MTEIHAPLPGAAANPPRLGSALTLTTASQVAATASVLALTTIPTLVAASMGIAPGLLGYQVSLIYAAGILLSMLSGGLVKRWGAGRVGQLALLAAGVGFLGLASGSWIGMAAASVLIGLGYALNNPSSSHILARLAAPERRNLVFSVKQAGVPIGGMLAALLIPALSHVLGWQRALMICAIGPLALVALYQLVRGSWDTDRDPSVKLGRGMLKGQVLVWSNPDLRSLALLGFLYSGVQLSISTFMVAMLVEQFGWHPLQAAAVAAVLQGAGAVGRLAAGLVADALKSGFLVLALIGFLTGVSILGFALIGSFTVVGLGCVVLSGLTGLGWNGVLLAETARVSPGRGTLTGEVLTYTFLGVTVGPAAFSTLFLWTGNFAATFALFSIPALIGAVLCLHRHRMQRREMLMAP